MKTARWLREVAEYINYYCSERKHSSPGYLTPMQFERLTAVRA